MNQGRSADVRLLMFKIRPVTDGVVKIISRLKANESTQYLLWKNNNLTLTTTSSEATRWDLQYVAQRGSYLIWVRDTNLVLDATRRANATPVCFDRHGAAWQMWAIGLQINNMAEEAKDRGLGYTLTPLSQPQSILTAAASVPRVDQAPHYTENFGPQHIWVFSGVERRLWALDPEGAQDAPAESGGEGQAEGGERNIEAEVEEGGRGDVGQTEPQ
ncbi:hypothetical protein EYR40_009938 [Pleurotus pulmonarius]|nr:hypothetical protein EYR36_004091 [Pleurotus pulmonarius]KAF4581645.1 hypothetical protein EYR38_002974 [Pleurotus pulmonarius]KAF4591335.1 hypothetical protein EYR40_009938 [Pleurotus pulmonarius]